MSAASSPRRGFWYIAAYPIAAVMLVFWAVMTFAFDGPGWVHLFLSLGVFLLIWRVVAGGTQEAWERYLEKRRRTGS